MEENQDDDETTRQDLSRKVALAADVAKNAPGFEPLAFQRVLDYLLRAQGGEVRPERRRRTAKSVARRGASSGSESERITPILAASAETISEALAWIEPLDQRSKLYGLLRVARDGFDRDGLTIPEVRSVANGKFRLGIPDGTLRGTLSRAPQSEVGREQTAEGETLYRLMRPGDEALDAAIEKARGRPGRDKGASRAQVEEATE